MIFFIVPQTYILLKLQISLTARGSFRKHSRGFLIILQNALFYFNLLLAVVGRLLYKSNDTTSPKITVKKVIK